MQQHDQAVNILRKGLNIPQTNDEQYQIFLKIIDVVSSCKGVVCYYISSILQI